MEQIRAEIALQAQWEPWTAMTGAFGTGADLAAAMLALAVHVVSHLH